MWVKILMAVNVILFRLSRGIIGSRMAGQSVLLLHTVGHKSGKRYTTPVNYYRDGENYILVASNWGKDTQPGWYHNLMNQPAAAIQARSRAFSVKACKADGEEYKRLWAIVTSQNAFYTRYQEQTKRKIPILVLTPIS
jgi:deazaflavin-dependent oxidoreductase (nitroreductase family)